MAETKEPGHSTPSTLECQLRQKDDDSSSESDQSDAENMAKTKEPGQSTPPTLECQSRQKDDDSSSESDQSDAENMAKTKEPGQSTSPTLEFQSRQKDEDSSSESSRSAAEDVPIHKELVDSNEKDSSSEDIFFFPTENWSKKSSVKNPSPILPFMVSDSEKASHDSISEDVEDVYEEFKVYKPFDTPLSSDWVFWYEPSRRERRTRIMSCKDISEIDECFEFMLPVANLSPGTGYCVYREGVDDSNLRYDAFRFVIPVDLSEIDKIDYYWSNVLHFIINWQFKNYKNKEPTLNQSFYRGDVLAITVTRKRSSYEIEIFTRDDTKSESNMFLAATMKYHLFHKLPNILFGYALISGTAGFDPLV